MTHISLDPAAWARHFGSCRHGRSFWSWDLGLVTSWERGCTEAVRSLGTLTACRWYGEWVVTERFECATTRRWPSLCAVESEKMGKGGSRWLSRKQSQLTFS